jgi:molecular chaperone DnaJ
VNEAYDVLKDADKKAAYDRFGHAAFDGGMAGGARAGGFGGPQGQGDFASAFSDVFEDLFGDFMGGQQRGGGRGPRQPWLGPALQPQHHARRRLFGSAKADQRAHLRRLRILHGTGSEGGSEPVTCPTCSGMGKVRAQQGFFTVERTCPTCSGVGQIVKNPCKTCGGAGRVQKDRALNVNIPPVSKPAPVSACPARERPGCAAGRRAISTSSSRLRNTRCSSATAWTCIAAFRCR